MKNACLVLLVLASCASEVARNAPSLKFDVLAEALEMNSSRAPDLFENFRPGTLRPAQVAPRMVQATGEGFVIHMTGGPVPTPCVSEGRLYTGGGVHSKEFYCFDARNGAPIWAVELGDEGPGTPVCESGAVLFCTQSCTLFALDAASGAHLWSWWLGDPMLGAPTVCGNRVFAAYPVTAASAPFPSAAGNFFEPSAPATRSLIPSHAMACFDLSTGKILWQKWIDGDVISAPVAAGDRVYAATFTGTLFCFRQEDGAILAALKANVTSAPTFSKESLFFTRRVDGEGEIREATVRVDAQTHREIYSANRRAAVYLDRSIQSNSQLGLAGKTMDEVGGFPAGPPLEARAHAAALNVGQESVSCLQNFQGSRVSAADGRIYNCMGDALVCADEDTGETRWSFPLEGNLEKNGGALAAPPVPAGNSLFAAAWSGDLLQIESATGRVRRTYRIGSPMRWQPVVENGRIYVSTEDGRVVCVDARDESATGWPMWGGDPMRTGCRH